MTLLLRMHMAVRSDGLEASTREGASTSVPLTDSGRDMESKTCGQRSKNGKRRQLRRRNVVRDVCDVRWVALYVVMTQVIEERVSIDSVQLRSCSWLAHLLASILLPNRGRAEVRHLKANRIVLFG